MSISETLSHCYPELFLVLSAMALLIIGVFVGDKHAREIALASVAVLIVAGVLVVMGPSGDGVRLFDGAFKVDQLAAFSKLIIFVAAAVVILMSERFLGENQLGRFEYSVLILLAVFGMALMVSATDLIALYMGVETQSLALYILAAFNRDSRRSTEAGLKYFVLGALSSCLLLYGASLVYGFAGSTSFATIADNAIADVPNVGLVIGLVFVICGLAFKVSAAPFHMWTPDVYEGAPTPVTAFFSAAPKFAAMVLFTRVLVSGFPNILDQWQPVLQLIAIASMLVGAFSALMQRNIKRLMAYSSIGHMGYALIGLTAGGEQGVTALLIYMSLYMIMTVGTFATILMMRRSGGMTESIDDLAGLWKTNMPLAVIITVLFFSLAGIPPTAGFWGKLYVFSAAIEADLIVLAVIGAVTSVVSAVYYLNVIRIIWLSEPAPAFERNNGPVLGLTAMVSAALMFPILTVLISPLRVAAADAARVLF
ncbi:MAG: NADH-quinone oxidoreductase subunit NuoN [Pseudomonadota bacterium]